MFPVRLKNGCSARVGARFLFVWLVLFGLTSTAFALDEAEFEELTLIASRGAPGLALRLLDKMQSQYGKDEAWLTLERKRIELLSLSGNGPAVIRRLQRFPSGWRPSVRRWVGTELAKALLQERRFGDARDVLRGLLWGEHDAVLAEQFVWRRLLVASYVHEGRNVDASRAIARLIQDYDAQDVGLILLKARALLQSAQFDDVELLLNGIKGYEAHLLRLVAGLRKGGVSPRKILADATGLASRYDLGSSLRQEAWALVAEAALGVGNLPGRILALEKVFSATRLSPSLVSIFHIDVAGYWAACLSYGETMANRDQLLVGEDAIWLATVTREGKDAPVRARALLTLMIDQSVNVVRKDRAALQLVDLLRKSPKGGRLILRLFSEGGPFGSQDNIPRKLRSALVDLAVAEGRLDLAASFSVNLVVENDRAFLEQLRIIRLLLLGGKQDHALAELGALLRMVKRLDKNEVDRLLQVLFDMQALGLNKKVIALFDVLLTFELDNQVRREIYYWMADSFKATSQSVNAARYYLQSAGLVDPYSMDRWAQTARYQAAEQLVLSGLNDDARRIYRNLLNVAKDPTRKAVLLSKIQRLHSVGSVER